MKMILAMAMKYDLTRLKKFLKNTAYLNDIDNYTHATFFWMDDKWHYIGGNFALLKMLKLKVFSGILQKSNAEIVENWDRDIETAKKLDWMNKAIIVHGSYCLLEEEIGEDEKILSIKGPLFNKDGSIRGLIGISKFNLSQEVPESGKT